jgi:hypothetical protein
MATLAGSRKTHHSPRPFIHDLDQPGFKLFPKRVVLHRARNLLLFHLVGNAIDDFQAFGEPVADLRLARGFLDKDEYG